jgi:hypothetical protein
MNADKFFVFNRRLSAFIGGWAISSVFQHPVREQDNVTSLFETMCIPALPATASTRSPSPFVAYQI